MPSINGMRPNALIPYQGDNVVRPMFRSMGIAASGLAAQRQRMESIAQNIANADVTRGVDGAPYKRRDVILETATSQNALFPGQNLMPGFGSSATMVRGESTSLTQDSDGRRAIEVPVLQSVAGGPGIGVAGLSGEYGVRVAGYTEDQGEGHLVYEPGHPDANANGFVRYPNIDTTQELVRLMDAKRMYEANAAVFQTAKSIMRASLDI